MVDEAENVCTGGGGGGGIRVPNWLQNFPCKIQGHCEWHPWLSFTEPTNTYTPRDAYHTKTRGLREISDSEIYHQKFDLARNPPPPTLYSWGVPGTQGTRLLRPELLWCLGEGARVKMHGDLCRRPLRGPHYTGRRQMMRDPSFSQTCNHIVQWETPGNTGDPHVFLRGMLTGCTFCRCRLQHDTTGT